MQRVFKTLTNRGLQNAIMASRATITNLNLNQHPLPKQPVPDLKKTAERYLRSLKPLLQNNEYCRTERLVKEFISDKGAGPKLHQKLLERFEKTENWMSEWWLYAAYLGYRAPVIVNSNPGTVSSIIKMKGPDDMYAIAGKVVRAVCEYNQSLFSGKVKQEMARDTPLDMQPYAMILGTHRQPSPVTDNLLHTDDARHIIILSNNNFFKLCLGDKEGLLSEAKLTAAIKDVAQRSCKEGKPVGILTGNDRDTWANDHCLLIGLKGNEQIVKDIETSLFVLCLDKEMPEEAFKCKNNASIRALQSLTGFSSCTNAANRWHDKTVQYIISPDGFLGMEYEHSPCEGVPVAVLHDHVLKYISSNKDAPPSNTKCGSSSTDFPRAQRLKFELNDELETAIKTATTAVDKLSNNLDMECFKFDAFGSNAIKQMKMSPDSFIQMAMQVTYYKLHGEPPAHYESAALRRFKNARTECIRSTSIESVKFAKMMACNDSSVSKEEMKAAMIAAIDVHKKLASEAATGQGCDRHLFGLRMIAQSLGMDMPEVFTDIGYTKSTAFTLTSSQVPYKSASFMCYGPVQPDGYGCCYNPRPQDIIFACSSFKSSKKTCSKGFAETLQQTLCNMKNLGSG